MKTNLIIYLTLAAAMAASAFRPANAAGVHATALRIVESNLGIRSQEAALEADLLDRKADNTLPPLEVEYSPFFRSGATGLASSELVVSQGFDFPTRYAMQSDVTNKMRDRSAASMASLRRDLYVEASQLGITLVYARRKMEVLQRRLSDADSVVALTRRLIDHKAATALDLNRAILARGDAERELIEAGLEYSDAESSLRRLACGADLDLENLEYDSEVDDIALPASGGEFAAESPAVATAQREVEVAAAERRVAASSWLPSFSIGYRRNTELQESADGFLVGISLPLYSIGKKGKGARAREAAASLAADDARLQKEFEAEGALRNLATLRRAMAACDVATAEESIRLCAEALRLGSITLTEYFSQTESLYSRLLDRLRLEHDYRRLAASISEYNFTIDSP